LLHLLFDHGRFTYRYAGRHMRLTGVHGHLAHLGILPARPSAATKVIHG
jgi:hypothetical protein